jgi:hypothetical protein
MTVRTPYPNYAYPRTNQSEGGPVSIILRSSR